MIVSSYQETKAVQEMPGVKKREVACADKGAPNFCMRVFDLDPKAATPYHQHSWEHEVYVLAGNGVAVSEKGETPVQKDSVVFVPPDEMHCFRNTGKEALRFICVIPHAK